MSILDNFLAKSVTLTMGGIKDLVARVSVTVSVSFLMFSSALLFCFCFLLRLFAQVFVYNCFCFVNIFVCLLSLSFAFLSIYLSSLLGKCANVRKKLYGSLLFEIVSKFLVSLHVDKDIKFVLWSSQNEMSEILCFTRFARQHRLLVFRFLKSFPFQL